MNTLLILAAIGTVAGGMGGALTNGLDGFILGSCGGFVLGVITWVTETMPSTRVQELNTDQLRVEFRRIVPTAYEQTITPYEQHSERVQSPK